MQLSYLEFPSCFFKPKPTENKVHTYIEKGNIHFPLIISCITYVELHTNYRKVFQLESGKLLWTFLTWMMTKSISYEDSLAHFIGCCSYSAPFFCAIFPIVSTCHPMTLLGAKSYLGLPPPRCAHGFTRLQMSSSLTIARRVGSDTSATATRRRRQYLTG